MQKIQLMLEKKDSLFGHLNIGNLKSITAKQFTDYIATFIQIVSGETVTATKPADVESDILAFMKSVNYPNSINKSWLKAPNIPHSFPECMALMAWLTDFVSFEYDEELAAQGEERFVECDPELLSIEFTKYFSEQIRNGFWLWNDQSEESFEQWKAELVERSVIASLGGRINSLDELYSLTGKLKAQVAQLSTYDFTIPNEQQLEVLEAQVQQGEAALRALTASAVAKADRLAAIELKLNERQVHAQEKMRSIETLKRRIARQRWSIDEYSALSNQLVSMRQYVEMEKNSIIAIKNDNVALQVHIARLIHQKNGEISKFNQLVFKLTQVIARSKLSIPLDPKALHIETSYSYDQIRSIAKQVCRIYDRVQSARHGFEADIERCRAKLGDLANAEQFHSKAIDGQREKLKSVRAQLSELNESELKKSTKIGGIVDSLTESQHSLLNEKTQIGVRIEQKAAQITESQNEIIDTFNDFQTQAAEILQKKSEWMDDIDRAITVIDEMSITK